LSRRYKGKTPREESVLKREKYGLRAVNVRLRSGVGRSLPFRDHFIPRV
jgi:hypothetical protein